jgi:hypothetical protein
MRPIENANVATFAHIKNTMPIALKDVAPGDIITMVSSDEIKNAAGRSILDNRDHILVVHQVEYQNFIPTTIHYSHSIAWPTDGEYGHGVRQGIIEVYHADKPITEQDWTENGKIGDENYTFVRAKKSKTDIRRFPWMS